MSARQYTHLYTCIEEPDRDRVILRDPAIPEGTTPCNSNSSYSILFQSPTTSLAIPQPFSEDTFTHIPSKQAVHPIAHDKYTGLVALPSELLLEIVAHFPEISIANIIEAGSSYLPADCSQRSTALRALSQTCKELRAVVLPLAWERLEACTLYSTLDSGWQQAFVDEASVLLWKCRGLLHSPHLIPHVRIITVSLIFEVLDQEDVLLTFVECIQALTNLHTMQIVQATADKRHSDYIKNAFEGHIFPSVRTMIIPEVARHILYRCPNVEELTWVNVGSTPVDGEYFPVDDPLFSAVKFTKLKKLRRIAPNKNTFAISRGDATVSASNLELIRVICSLKISPEIQGFRNFKNLDTIEIEFAEKLCRPDYETTLENRKNTLIPIARGVLKASKSTKEKRIRLLYRRKEGFLHDSQIPLVREFKEETLLI